MKGATINWPGELPLDETTTEESMLITSAHQEKYKCSLPTTAEEKAQQEDSYDGPTALELLSPLFSPNQPCSFRLESYWTYQVCHGRKVRQYHEDREGKTMRLHEYVIGKWDSDYYETLLEKTKEREKDRTLPPPVKKIESINLPYYEIVMENGTQCSLKNNNKPRTTKVLYVCYIHGKHEIYSVDEPQSCVYEIIILSPLLCAHPKYKPKESGENKINCAPVDGSYKMPYGLAKQQYESALLRKKSDLNKFKVELLKFEKEDAIPDPSEHQLVDSAPVENFLRGKNCLNGGTGWWKFEFCYGKSVEQYHVEKNGKKVSINLGIFDRQAHLDWMKENPQKRPKPLGQRKQLSHLYSSGSICEKTGKPRQTEVKLKCLQNASSPNAVSLYLLEPKLCQYILGVESPLICDILSRANEDGLVETEHVEFEETEKATVNVGL
ncbi:unnamed protein product [Phyllotreta striolata]|uniref:Endoplasmic reticulum lectin 1 n=1 Tax=Phyllotreta striolata TaxID=444603 RepID=A0A9N9TYE5_PHYSR|nr:unnamed protein product [Phyllotreta striolata]